MNKGFSSVPSIHSGHYPDHGVVNVPFKTVQLQQTAEKDVCYLPKDAGKRVVKDLNELVQAFRTIFAENRIDIDEVQDLMASYQSKPEEWEQYAHFDQHKFTRNLVDTGNGKYNLMLICWSKGTKSPIHNHASCHCFMKVLSGSLQEVRFDWPKNQGRCESERMNVKEIKDVGTNDVTYMSDELGLHLVRNKSSTENAVSLHLYIPPYNSCKIFDPNNGKASTANCIFYSKGGRKV